jgi:putative ABC transport system permease protein
MAVSLVSGRHFNNTDTANSQPVVIADELFTAAMWPDESPLGKRVQLNPSEPTSDWLTVIGVTPHITQAPAFMGGKRELTSLYRPLSQDIPQQIQLAVKVQGDPDEYRQSVITAVMRVDRDIALTSIYSLNELQALSASVLELVSSIFAAISCVVVVLAATGIYGLVSRGVLHRTREIGVRRALGLTNYQAIGLFLRQGSAYLLTSLLIGGGAGLMISRAVAGLFPEILNVVLFILLGVSIFMTVLVLAASYIPARRVVAIEPGAALRYE